MAPHLSDKFAIGDIPANARKKEMYAPIISTRIENVSISTNLSISLLEAIDIVKRATISQKGNKTIL